MTRNNPRHDLLLSRPMSAGKKIEVGLAGQGAHSGNAL